MSDYQQSLILEARPAAVCAALTGHRNPLPLPYWNRLYLSSLRQFADTGLGQP
ncbi:MAG TPA: hypothetical protein VGP06_14535 [Janthinobacterium sp.]|jgi:hypothetical protein|nr:hypothetical protein [Janthinobacterium sp.]